MPIVRTRLFDFLLAIGSARYILSYGSNCFHQVSTRRVVHQLTKGGMFIMFVSIVMALFIIGFVLLALYVGMTQNGGIGTDDALANLRHMHDEAAAHRLPMVR